jgi:hypothetical protein
MEQTNPAFAGSSFYGGAGANGNPMYFKDGLILMPGQIYSDATNLAYFGYVVSSDEATPGLFKMGTAGAKRVGVLYAEAGIMQNEPAKNNRILANTNATTLKFGLFTLKSWTHAGTGALTTPTRTSLVIYKDDTGQIEFIAAATPVPSGYTLFEEASVVIVDTNVNGVGIFVNMGVDKTVAASTKAITAFSIVATGATGFSAVGNIVESTGAISVTVPSGTTVTALVANFIHNGASIAISSTAQVSGVTANNFTSPVAYVVTAADGTTKTYTVTVTVHS